MLISDAMKVLDVSRTTMMAWLEEGKFPGARKVGGATSPWVIPADDVESVRQERLAEMKRQMARIARPVNEYRDLYEYEVSTESNGS